MQKMAQSQPTRILYIHSSADAYGSDRVLFALLSTLDKKQYKPLVLIPERGELTKSLKKAQIPFLVQPMSIIRKADMNLTGIFRYFFGFIPSTLQIIRICRTHHISIVHTNTSVIFPGAIAAKILNIPHIWHIREFFRLPPIIRTIYAALIYALSTRIITISKEVATQFPWKKKVEVIYDGLDAKKFDTKRTGYGLRQKNVIHIGTVGRINAIKGHTDLVRAFAKVQETYPNSQLTIVGDVYKNQVQYKRELKQLIRTLHLTKNVRLAGFQKNVTPFLASFDLFVMPSRSEGLGAAALEAMAAGLPVIASRVGGLKEIIKHRKTGLVCKPGDANDIARKILTALASTPLRAKLGKQGKQFITANFSLERMTESIEDVYDTTLTNAPLTFLSTAYEK
jgi:glycosyltransferase involved in cell wall biosynthesis